MRACPYSFFFVFGFVRLAGTEAQPLAVIRVRRTRSVRHTEATIGKENARGKILAFRATSFFWRSRRQGGGKGRGEHGRAPRGYRGAESVISAAGRTFLLRLGWQGKRTF